MLMSMAKVGRFKMLGTCKKKMTQMVGFGGDESHGTIRKTSHFSQTHGQ